jgi:hypothetical protein
MKHAIAMYRAGMVVDAGDCNYDSARMLGLICPFCSEAVFWKTGHIRRKGMQDLFIAPQFAHYKNDDPLAQNCELRAKSQQGQEDIERIRQESHNQRLKLYNRHLWEMFKDDRNISRKKITDIQKDFGRKWCETRAKKIQREFRNKRSLMYQGCLEYVQDAADGMTKEEYRKSIDAWEKSGIESDINLQVAYFQGVDRQIHLSICKEIIDFCCTRTSGYAFLNIFTAFLISARWSLAGTLFSNIPKELFSQSFDFFTEEVKKATDESFAIGIALTIAGTHWIDQINKRLGDRLT